MPEPPVSRAISMQDDGTIWVDNEPDCGTNWIRRRSRTIGFDEEPDDGTIWIEWESAREIDADPLASPYSSLPHPPSLLPPLWENLFPNWDDGSLYGNAYSSLLLLPGIYPTDWPEDPTDWPEEKEDPTDWPEEEEVKEGLTHVWVDWVLFYKKMKGENWDDNRIAAHWLELLYDEHRRSDTRMLAKDGFQKNMVCIPRAYPWSSQT